MLSTLLLCAVFYVHSIVGRLNESSQLSLPSNQFRPVSGLTSALIMRGVAVVVVLLLVPLGLVKSQDSQPTGNSTNTSTDKDETKPTQLLSDAKFTDNWTYFSADSKTSISDTWVQKKDTDNSQILVCTGKPFGYLKTKKKYENFEFGFEWRYANGPNGNSGVLLHTEGEDKIWPKAIQIQLHRPKAGSIFPSGGATTDNTLEVKDLNLETGKWHECVIMSKSGTVAVSIDGKKLGSISGCNPRSGPIAFQSEGSEIHFRKIWVRNLTDDEMKTTTPPKE